MPNARNPWPKEPPACLTLPSEIGRKKPPKPPNAPSLPFQGELWNGNEDDVIWFSTDHAAAVAAAILEAAGLDATALASEGRRP